LAFGKTHLVQSWNIHQAIHDRKSHRLVLPDSAFLRHAMSNERLDLKETISDSPSATEDSSYHSIPPMTSPWNVPQTCTWTYNAASEPVPGATGAVAWLDLEPEEGATSLSCYPDQMFVGERTGVFSPAICPSGWTTATIVANTDEDHDHATTTAICCSS
jgi:hypothetical protein